MISDCENEEKQPFHHVVLPAHRLYAFQSDTIIPAWETTMIKRLFTYLFLAASKLNGIDCGQRILGNGFAKYEVSSGAKSICYTYITTILVTIDTDSSTSHDDINSFTRQNKPPTCGQAENYCLSFETSGFPTRTGMSNSPGHSVIAPPISTVTTGDKSENAPANNPPPDASAGPSPTVSGHANSIPGSNTAPDTTESPSKGPPGSIAKSQTTAEVNPTFAVSASTIILSVEPMPSLGSTQQRRMRLRMEPSWKRDSDPGFVGDSRNPNPRSCSDAVRYRQSNGQLQRRGRFISVDFGVDYIDMTNFVGGSISTVFSVVNDTLQWDNEAFYNGRATFCQVDNEIVYVVFKDIDRGPEGCTPVFLVVYRGNVEP
ncbi:hypothetical protein PG987_011089 [Apiospora arundinis]